MELGSDSLTAATPGLLAFGFGSAAMLSWLAAAALPIVIHLWNKRKYREAPWAAMEFLLAAVRKNSRRIQLEQWILLAIRTLLILLLVLAVAQPYFEDLGLTFVAGERTLKVFVIDGSYSMAYKPTDKTRFEKAKQSAAQFVNDSRQGDAFALVLLAAPPAVIVGVPSVEPRAFLEEIENLKMPQAGADLPATLAKVEEILDRAEAGSLARKEVYFFSDLGRNTWAPDGAVAERRTETNETANKPSSAAGAVESANEYRDQVERLARLASLMIIDLGQGSGGENVAVTGLRANEPFVTVAEEASFEAQVRNFGQQPQNHHLVECFVDGRRVKQAYLDIVPGGQTPITFSHRFDAPADHIIEVRSGPDLLEVDNHRWLAQRVKDHLRVLCVNGKPSGGGLSGATDFLVRALNPEEDSLHRGVARPEIIPESNLAERNLADYDCVFLCNIGQFTASEARLLESYVRQGGGLVIFLGDRVLADRYNRLVGPASPTPILPAEIKELMPEGQYRFDPLEYRHSLAAGFKGREQAGLLTTPIYKYFRLALPERSPARVAIGFEGGDPAIVEFAAGRGRVLLVATDGSLSSLDPSTRTPWTAWPAWPSYLPLVQEMLATAVAGERGQRNRLVGQPLGQSIDYASSKATLTLSTPDGRREDLRMTTDAEGSRWTFADTSLSGVYTLDASAARRPEELFAVNLDTAESNLTRIDPLDLPKSFLMNRQTDGDDSDAPTPSRRSGANRLLLYGVLGLLFVESFLAWRFGNRRS
jgi:hypothetical protein